MKKIWITGAEGHIGTALLELLEGVEYQLLPTDIHEVDITKIDEVTQFVYVNRPDVIINCAGMTDVAECEKNIDEAYRVNAIGVRNVALAANDIDAKVIQIYPVLHCFAMPERARTLMKELSGKMECLL